MKNKIFICLLVIMFTVECIICVNLYIDKKQHETYLSSEMIETIFTIRKNIDDCISKKEAVDEIYIYQNCTLFSEHMYNYITFFKKDLNTERITALIQNYKALILEISMEGYTADHENELLKFKRHFGQIDVDDSGANHNFDIIIEKYNAYVDEIESEKGD